jgi:hypothetical protein
VQQHAIVAAALALQQLHVGAGPLGGHASPRRWADAAMGRRLAAHERCDADAAIGTTGHERAGTVEAGDHAPTVITAERPDRDRARPGT